MLTRDQKLSVLFALRSMLNELEVAVRCTEKEHVTDEQWRNVDDIKKKIEALFVGGDRVGEATQSAERCENCRREHVVGHCLPGDI